MKSINPYLIFSGNCREAMTLYADAFGAELSLSTYGDMPGATEFAGSQLILHARLSKGDIVLMGSDSHPEKGKVVVGNNVQITINCDSREEVDALFAKLSVNGKVEMAPSDTFWNAYFAMLADQFGTEWMLNFEKPRES